VVGKSPASSTSSSKPAPRSATMTSIGIGGWPQGPDMAMHYRERKYG
jgi:hypothetical protein